MLRRRFLETAAVLGRLRPAGVSASTFARERGERLSSLRPGVNLCGAEFGEGGSFSNENPGVFDQDYTYNSEKTVAWFAERGAKLFRLPFRWERIQPKLGGPLNPGELERLKKLVAAIANQGAKSILDVHNYGRYRLVRNGKPIEAPIDGEFDGRRLVTRDHFADLWSRLSRAFENAPGVWALGLMNEPHDMGRSNWKEISRTAVRAIRATGDRRPILVAGDSWSNSARWTEINGPEPWIDDSGIVYEAHCYLDADFSGTYRLSYRDELKRDPETPDRVWKRLVSFAGWCAIHGVDGFIGEFGVPGDDPGWLRLLDLFLEATAAAGLDWCFWAAGDWWPKEYKLSIQPRDGRAAAQWNRIQDFIRR